MSKHHLFQKIFQQKILLLLLWHQHTGCGRFRLRSDEGPDEVAVGELRTAYFGEFAATVRSICAERESDVGWSVPFSHEAFILISRALSASPSSSLEASNNNQNNHKIMDQNQEQYGLFYWVLFLVTFIAYTIHFIFKTLYL